MPNDEGTFRLSSSTSCDTLKKAGGEIRNMTRGRFFCHAHRAVIYLKKTGGEVRNGKTSPSKKHNRHLTRNAERSGWA